MKYKIKKKNVFILFGLILAIFILNFAFTYAKYAFNSTYNYYLKTKDFYFSSDNLDINGLKNIDSAWDGSNIEFNIKNSINEDQVTEYDIKYTATCNILEGDDLSCVMYESKNNIYNGTLSSNETCSNTKDDDVDVSSYNKIKCEMNGYTWSNLEANKDLYFKVVNNSGNEVKDALVEVTVASTSPYNKSLKGTFRIHKGNKNNEEIKKEYTSYTNYDIFSLTNSYNTNKCEKISFDSSKLRIDTEDLLLAEYTEDSNGYINSITLNLERNKDYNLKIYKTKFDEIYNDKDFTVTESSKCQ